MEPWEDRDADNDTLIIGALGSGVEQREVTAVADRRCGVRQRTHRDPRQAPADADAPRAGTRDLGERQLGTASTLTGFPSAPQTAAMSSTVRSPGA